jgi:hypothetical protein
MALKADGTVVVWGGDEYGQTNVPVGLANVTQISAGYYHCLALVNDGTVTAWGTDYWGICNVPLGLSQVVAVSAGGELSLALKADGTVVAWGDTNAMDGYPALVPKGLNNVISISAGQGHALALKSDGTVVAWGDNSYGESTVPPGLTNVTSVSAGNGFSIALKGDGTVVAWGDDTYEETDVPIGLTNIASISAGSSWCALALQDDGTPVTWGMAGTQTLDPPFNLQPVSEIEAGGYFALAIQVAQPLLSTGPPRQPKKIQKISFPNVSTKSYGVTFLLNATASSKLQVTYGVISAPATLSGVKVSTTVVGTVTLAADQLGNTKYAPANEVIRSFNVIKASQKISQFKTIPEKNTQSKPFSIILPTSSSGLPVSVTLKSGPATISGNTVTLNGVRGEVVLSANQLGNPDYIPAHEVSTSFVVKNH